MCVRVVCVCVCMCVYVSERERTKYTLHILSQFFMLCIFLNILSRSFNLQKIISVISRQLSGCCPLTLKYICQLFARP